MDILKILDYCINFILYVPLLNIVEKENPSRSSVLSVLSVQEFLNEEILIIKNRHLIISYFFLHDYKLARSTLIFFLAWMKQLHGDAGIYKGKGFKHIFIKALF